MTAEQSILVQSPEYAAAFDAFIRNHTLTPRQMELLALCEDQSGVGIDPSLFAAPVFTNRPDVAANPGGEWQKTNRDGMWFYWPLTDPDYVEVSTELLVECKDFLTLFPWPMVFVANTSRQSVIFKRNVTR